MPGHNESSSGLATSIDSVDVHMMEEADERNKVQGKATMGIDKMKNTVVL